MERPPTPAQGPVPDINSTPPLQSPHTPAHRDVRTNNGTPPVRSPPISQSSSSSRRTTTSDSGAGEFGRSQPDSPATPPARNVRRGSRSRQHYVRNFIDVNPNLDSIKSNMFNIEDKLDEKCLHLLEQYQREGIIDLADNPILVYISDSAEGQIIEVLDGRHRVEAFRAWFVKTYGPRKIVNAEFDLLSARCIVTVLNKGEKVLCGWLNHGKSETAHQTTRAAQKNVTDLINMKSLLFPDNTSNTTASRTLSGKIRSRLASALTCKLAEHHVYIAFRTDKERLLLLRLARAVETRKICNNEKNADKTTFWRTLIPLLKNGHKQCLVELERYLDMSERQSGNAAELLETLRHNRSEMSMFLYKYYRELPTSCSLYRSDRFLLSDCFNLMRYCKTTFRLDELIAKHQKPCHLRMLKAAALFLGVGKEENPLITTLNDLCTPDWGSELLVNHCFYTVIDTHYLANCSTTVMRELIKMEDSIRSVLILAPSNLEDLEDEFWLSLKQFIQGWFYDTAWDVLHSDVQFGSPLRHSRLLHFKKDESFMITDRTERSVVMNQISAMYPTNCGGAYFVGNRDCRFVGRHTVPKTENNVIVYRYIEDLRAAHKETSLYTKSQYFDMERVLDDDLNPEDPA
ncbi:unnamed protein product [Bursaphelenchus okinawaensis]|uniref:Uncharacterized protein n=1 Tax=Bursaphelenchus okinawaensis TaxID=465554 RepID=A0A811LHI9_9BILA|nr:unnamed protein product [Bursaphelenchus okinawaensis]CAG9123937.1 unnamed protein product [Bursaphelenchus okinawaensis]